MRGTTNAVPAAGGLKVIAEGTIALADGGGGSVSMPSPAAVVCFNLYQLSGEPSTWTGVLLPGGGTMYNPNDKSQGNLSLSADGNTLAYSSFREVGRLVYLALG